MLRILSFVTLVGLTWTPAARGQEGHASSTATASKSLCFKPGPRLRCRSFMVTEIAWSSTGFGDRNDPADRLQWDLGIMMNVDETQAWGATLAFGRTVFGHWGVSARYRRWVDSDLTLDVSPGFVVVGDSYDGRHLQATLAVTALIGASIGPVVHGRSTKDGGRIGSGVRLSSWPGFVVGTLLYAFSAAIPYT